MAKKIGRPSLYKAEYGEQLIEHCKTGGFIESFALKINVHTDTLREWEKVHEEFSVAYKKARMAQLEHFMMLGYDLANGRVKGQVAAWCFMMKNMFGWRDVQEVDLHKTTHQKLIINMGKDE